MKYAPYPYYPSPSPSPLRVRGTGTFTQGFVAAACISAFQDVAHPECKADYKRILRHGLQGGTALAAGAHTAVALRHSDYTSALLSIGIGAAGVLLLEKLLSEKANPQEEASDE